MTILVYFHHQLLLFTADKLFVEQEPSIQSKNNRNRMIFFYISVFLKFAMFGTKMTKTQPFVKAER